MDALWILLPVAVLMSGVVAALVRWSSEARTVVAASVVIFLLAMMVAMFVATAVYFTWPGARSLVLALWVAAVLMAASAFPVLALVWREARDHLLQGSAYAPRRLASTGSLAATVVVLVFVGELLMGRSFGLAAGTLARGNGSTLGAVGVATVASPWFLFPMALEMALTLAWLRPRLPPPLVGILAAQVAAMGFSPPAIPGARWLVASALVTSGAMGGVLAYLLRGAYAGTRLPRGVRSYVVRFLGVSALMGAGLAVWVSAGSLVLFALATIASMAIFFDAVVVPEAFSAPAAGPTAGTPEARPGDRPSPR